MPLKDPVLRAAYLKKQYKLNRNERLVKQKEYHFKNRDRELIRMKEYSKKIGREKQNEDMRRFMAKKRQQLVELKNVPCFDCGLKFHPAAMDFDHREGEIKSFNLGRLSNWNKKTLMIEVEKCDIVCANCHRIRTYNRIKRKD